MRRTLLPRSPERTRQPIPPRRRRPDRTEQKILADFYAEELKRFRAQPAQALEYLRTGERAWDAALQPEEIAALATVSNSIMNTDEGYTRK